MRYEYKCSCGHEFIVVKCVAARDAVEKCVNCHNNDVPRKKVPSRLGGIVGAADWNTQHHNHSLGMTVRSNNHARKVAKERGLSEVGDEPVEKIHKKFDNDRKKKLESRYDKITDTSLGEVRSDG